MPSLPNKDEIVRLDISKKSNNGKSLTAGVLLAIDKLPLSERITVMNFALNEDQIQQHDQWLIKSEKIAKTLDQHLEKKKKKTYPTRFEGTILYINNEPYDFNSSLRITVFLKELFKTSRSNLAKPRHYKDFFSEHKQKLESVDIDCDDIRDLRRRINNKIKVADFFSKRGLLSINSKYLD